MYWERGINFECQLPLRSCCTHTKSLQRKPCVCSYKFQLMKLTTTKLNEPKRNNKYDTCGDNKFSQELLASLTHVALFPTFYGRITTPIKRASAFDVCYQNLNVCTFQRRHFSDLKAYKSEYYKSY